MAKESLTPYKMNLPSDLKDRLSEAAQKSGRSLSAEIITRLQASISFADDNGMDFTYEAFEQMIIGIVQHETMPLEDRIRSLEREIAGIYNGLP